VNRILWSLPILLLGIVGGISYVVLYRRMKSGMEAHSLPLWSRNLLLLLILFEGVVLAIHST
jgi:hypothetical protein